MKDFLWRLVRFNAKTIALFALFLAVFFAIFRFNSLGTNNILLNIVGFSFLGVALYLVIGNFNIVWNRRKLVSAAFENAAIEVAASTIEFKEKANSRVQERLAQRRQGK